MRSFLCCFVLFCFEYVEIAAATTPIKEYQHEQEASVERPTEIVGWSNNISIGLYSERD